LRSSATPFLALHPRRSPPPVRSDHCNYLVLETFSKLDICNNLPRLRHDFCTSWNEIVLEAREQGPCATPVDILRGIRHPYLALHQGNDAAPTAFEYSLLPPTHTTTYCTSHRHIRAATSLAIAHSQSPTYLCTTLVEFLSLHHLVTHPMLCILHQPMPAAPSYNKPSKRTLLQDLRRLIRRQPAKSERHSGPQHYPPTDPSHSSPCPADDSPTGNVAATTRAIM